MFQEILALGALDYFPCRYGTSRLMFRGPKKSLDEPYLAFIGSTETYGKFIPKPFPDLIENVIGTTCVNFGQMNAGIDAFAYDPFVLEAASQAEVTVVQILGAHNMTNRFYSVHPRRNDRFVEAATLLKTIYREVDFANFHFNKHMLSTLLQRSPDRFEAVQRELQEAWKARMRLMLKRIQRKSVLLWFSDHAPEDELPFLFDTIGTEPLFVTREMIEEISPLATAVVEVVVSREALDAGTDGMNFSDLEEPAAAEMFNPMAHQEAADALLKVIKQIM
ncbi:DUF6473 family protein [Marimonas sp. MJW-29]|uniref:DUF6473 family protein n=1 Tax=Sulfitobacter sediminis TaxID=3234186 RepID=A0ABV3RIB1_9RHOB